MKTKWSLNKLLHNDRAMIVLSIIIAVAVWALVSFGPSNVTTHEFTAQVTVDLTNTIAGYNDLRVIGEDSFPVTVTVQGPRSVVFNLSSDDIVIRPNYSDVQGPGESVLQLTASKGGRSTDYEIVDIYPREVTVDCDYWVAADFPLATDVSTITVADEQTQQIGDVVLDTNAVPNGIVQLEGPRTIINQISSVVAKVETTETIANTTRFSAGLTALDAQGAAVDLTNCQFLTPSAGTIDLTVPVWVQKKVDLTYELLNVPKGFSTDSLVSLSMNSITLVGEEEELESMAQTVANLGVIDFDHLTPADSELVVSLNIPSTIRVLEDTSVTVKLAIGGYTTKTLSYSVNSVDDVTVENLPEGKTLTLQSQKLTNIVVCGPSGTLRGINADDLKIVLNAGGNTGNGSVRYSVRIELPEHPNVWVYYDVADQSSYMLYGTLE